MRDRPGPLERAAHEQPARARLDRDVHDPARETRDPLLDRSRRGLQLPAPQLPAHRVQRVERDLPPMHVKPGHDRSRSNAQHKGRAHHRLRGVTPDRCHTVIHGRYLQLRMTGGAGYNRARLQPTSFDTEDRPPAARPTATLRPWLLMSSFFVAPQRRLAIARRPRDHADRAGSAGWRTIAFAQTQRCAPPNRASRAAIAFLWSDRPDAPRAGDAYGDATIAPVLAPGVCAGRSGLPARCAWAPALARLPLSVSGNVAGSRKPSQEWCCFREWAAFQACVPLR